MDFSCTRLAIGGDLGFQSSCYIGNWQISASTQYTLLTPHSTRHCFLLQNSPYVKPISIRQFGPPDTATPAAAFDIYQPLTNDYRTLVVYDSEANIVNATDRVSSIWTTGQSSWTLYQHSNFQGAAVCITATAELQRFQASKVGLPTIGSAVRGCVGTKHRVVMENTKTAQEDEMIEGGSFQLLY